MSKVVLKHFFARKIDKLDHHSIGMNQNSIREQCLVCLMHVCYIWIYFISEPFHSDWINCIHKFLIFSNDCYRKIELILWIYYSVENLVIYHHIVSKTLFAIWKFSIVFPLSVSIRSFELFTQIPSLRICFFCRFALCLKNASSILMPTHSSDREKLSLIQYTNESLTFIFKPSILMQ